ncbi:hypothetical protein QTH91_19010 [Variovorax dokdonensis]|uniref:DUF2946 domain-containing protein n=1 Tax=Variovorax dokdonensis TaxID=344883 RepID=A0ABT7NF79_9BURK|nr:DUF2946 family protein [Variovorax dokdonensis]MDM0046587.1 hypothetical protein [Variovorax dokdonensis]
MHRLRRINLLHRLVLAWFMLSLGVAVASPVVRPKVMQVVCSVSSGAVVINFQSTDGDEAMQYASFDCPLCAAVGAPPPKRSAEAALPLPLGRAVQSIPAARLAAATAAPLPARGPPASPSELA